MRTPTHSAAFYKDDPKWLRALVELGADVDARSDTGLTPLILTVLGRREKATRYLVECGAKVDRTALQLAVKFQAHEVLRELLRSTTVDLDALCGGGQTVLHD